MAGVNASVGVGCLATSILNRQRLAPLALFALNAFSVAIFITFELLLMRAQTADDYGALLRWSQLPLVAIFISATVFVRLHLQAGRLWLAYASIALRLAALLINFIVAPNLHFEQILSVRQADFLGGARVAVPAGVVNLWTSVGLLSVATFLAFVADAVRECWRRDGPVGRRRALLVGGGYLVAVGAAAANGCLILFGVIDSVYTIGVPFTVVVLAICVELGTDVRKAAKLAARLQESELDRRRSHEHLTLAAEAAQLAAWEFDLAKAELLVNDQARALLGLDRSDRIDPRRVLDALDPADRPIARADAARLMQVGGEFDVEYRVTLAGRSSRWLHTRGRLDKDSAGRPVLLRGVTFDVTERREAAEQFRQLLEAAAFGMMGIDRAGTITLMNERAERLFGYARPELVGRPLATLLTAESNRQLSADIAGLFAEDTRHGPLERELIGRRKDGSEIVLETGLTAIRFHGETAVLASLVDLTGRKQAEHQLEMQRNELNHLARVMMLSELSGSLAHELNQPLTAILSNAQAALRFLDASPPSLAEVREILQDVASDGKRAGEIIHGLRLMHKRGELRHEPFDLNEVVANVLRLLKGTLVNANVSVTTRLEPDLPQVDGDRVQLQQVVMNMVVNACDAMRDATPENRRLTLKTDIHEGRLARLCIADRGHGIGPESLERIFEPFYTTKPNGLGLGLAVCRRIIEAHGGRLWAIQNAGHGTSVLFTLPLATGVPS
jgi:PAS domain S-box-containing protein